MLNVFKILKGRNILMVYFHLVTILTIFYKINNFDLYKGRFSNLNMLNIKTTEVNSNINNFQYKLENKSIENGNIKFLLKLTNLKNNNMDLNRYNFENISDEITLDINLISKDILQFIFRDNNTKRFELPLTDTFPYHKEKIIIDKQFNWKLGNLDLEYEFLFNEDPFSLEVLRKTTKEVIFSTKENNFFFADNYGEFTTELPTNNLFGLGERTSTFKLKSGIYTLYNKDLYGEIEDGKGQGKNRYGSHPMYLMREKSGKYHINYLRNSYPMDIILNFQDNYSNKFLKDVNIIKNSDGKNLITYKVVGGVFDFSIFLGDENPENVTKKYHKFLDGYSLPPFWAMGFHQCRWGYRNLKMIQDVLEGYKENNLPMDAIWMDIDYMNDYQPFTVDELRYDVNKFKKTLSDYKKKFVMIIEPTIGIKNSYFYLLIKGKEKDLFIKNSVNNYLLNRVWPGRSHFLDYFNPNTSEFWYDALKNLKTKLDFSGIWLDMNEIAAFEAGQVDMDSFKISCDDNKKYKYFPGNKVFETATICPNAKHYGDLEHIQIHNYYPNAQAKLTYEYLQKQDPDNFPFILTRANGPGIGKYAAHWSGDNYGTNEFLKFSIAEVINFNLFGAPMTGADICGFGYDTPEYLCARWYQMGALYPFSRSHSHMDYYRKEPFMMNKMLLETTKKSLEFRYSILKYYYMLFMRNNGSGMIFKPIFYEFYDDLFALNDFVIDNFFMIGDSLLVVPNLNSDEKYESLAYLPAGSWFDLRNNLKIEKNPKVGNLIHVKTDLYEMPAVFLRGGKIIFRNKIVNYSNSFPNSNKIIENTKDLDNNFDIYVAFDSSEFYDTEKNVFYSRGFIPALKNYNSKTSIENCMNKNCFVEILASYDKINKNIKIQFKKANYYEDDYDYISVHNIYILGLDLVSSDILNANYDKYIISKNTEDCVLLNYPGVLTEGKILLEKKDTQVIINLK